MRKFLLSGWLLIVALPGFSWDASEDLLAAARKGDLTAVTSALEAKADIETKTRYGQTPLFLAAMNGHTPVVKLLLDRNAQVDIVDTFYKFSLINFAGTRKHVDVLKLLLPKSKKPDENLDAMTRLGNAELIGIILGNSDFKPSQSALDRNLDAAGSNSALAELLTKAGAKPAAPVDVKTLESYSGTYKADGVPLEIKVFVKNSRLHLQATGQPEFAPMAKNPTTFEFAPANLQIEFTGADAFMLRQGGQNINFKKAVVTPQ